MYHTNKRGLVCEQTLTLLAIENSFVNLKLPKIASRTMPETLIDTSAWIDFLRNSNGAVGIKLRS